MRSLLVAVMLVAACGGAPSSTKPATEPAKPAGDDTTIALVYSAWEIWVGNDDITPEDDPSRYPGALKAIKVGLDQADLAHSAATGSQGLIVTYADKAVIRVPRGPIANLSSTALGTQKDYYNSKGAELVAGIRLAIDELDKATTSRRQLIILSDGNDTNNEAGKPALHELHKRMAALGIQATSIVYKSAMSGDANITTSLTSHATTVSSADALPEAIVQAIRRPRD